MSTVNYIVVHCSDSPNNRVDRRFDSAGQINEWHKEKGWAGIGYHYVIDENGHRANGRPIFQGTKTFWQGAHVKGFNRKSIGICLVGENYFHPEQMETLRNTIDELLKIWPDARVVGHRDLDPRKTCPGFDASDWYYNNPESTDEL